MAAVEPGVFLFIHPYILYLYSADFPVIVATLVFHERERSGGTCPCAVCKGRSCGRIDAGYSNLTIRTRQSSEIRLKLCFRMLTFQCTGKFAIGTLEISDFQCIAEGVQGQIRRRQQNTDLPVAAIVL